MSINVDYYNYYYPTQKSHLAHSQPEAHQSSHLELNGCAVAMVALE